MAITFVASSSAVGSGVTSLSCNLPAGIQVGDLLVIAYAFEGVASGSGPWIIPNIGQNSDGVGAFNGWQQLAFQSPSGTGAGLEVWGAFYGSGTLIKGYFAASQNAVAVIGAWRGQYNPNPNNIPSAPPRLSPSQAVTGNQPAAPAVNANNGELIIACAADTMTAANFGTPSGFSNRVDVTRGAAGTVEGTLADRIATLTGNTGPITFPNSASTSTAPGSTATLVFRPVPTTTGSGGIINAGLPEDLDIGPGYTLRVTALDPTTGNPVTGVTVSNLIFTAEQVAGTPEGLETGPFMLVPGPGA